MSFTDPWPFNPTTDSPYSLTDWLHLSPCTSSLQDISQSSRINADLESDLQAYTMASQATSGLAASQNYRSPSLPQVLTRGSDATLPVLCYTPSPNLVALERPETSDASSQLDPPSMTLTSSSFACSPLPVSQEGYDLKASPLAALFYFRESPKSLESDPSPVIRGNQDPLPSFAAPKPKDRKKLSRKKKRLALQMQSRALSFKSASALEATSSAPSHVSGPFLALLSPCRLTAKGAITSKAGNSSIGRDTDQRPLSAEDSTSTFPPISFRTLSGPDSPSELIIKRSKRPREEDFDVSEPFKRARRETPPLEEDVQDKPGSSQPTTAPKPLSRPIFTNRNLPPFVEISPSFPLFYRRFPASSYLSVSDESSPCLLFGVSHPGGTYNTPRDAFDLYTPRFVKGRGIDKVGLCPICIEPLERGGQKKKVWLGMKVSAFKCYHMQYFHGISSASGHPFSPPLAFRTVARKNPAKTERKEIKQGKCHKCSKWTAVEGIRDVECKVPEIYWWKHAASCHNQTSILGETGFLEEDQVHKRLLEL